MTRIAAFYPNYFHNKAICYVALSLIREMQSKDMRISLMGIASGADIDDDFYKNAIPFFLKSFIYHFFSGKQVRKIAELRFFFFSITADYIYLWPGTSVELFEKLKNRGQLLISENINTHMATAKSILDAEYVRLGLPISHGITLEKCVEETRKLSLSSYIFSCSPMVTTSLLNAKIPSSKILESSFGLRETDILEVDRLTNRSNTSEITAIFVGTIGVRKAPHLILDYWCRAKVKGKLRLIGDIDTEVLHIIEPYLKRLDIEHVSYVSDLSTIYADADIFLLPSLEEGSPLVTYLALGAGLPSIVSAMGAGGVIEHGKQGFVIDPHDGEAWISAIIKISEDVELRKSISRNAQAKAKEYLWSNVGRKRRELLLSKLNKVSEE